MTVYKFFMVFVLLFTNSVFANAYLLKPGDRLRIEVIEDNSLNRNALVLPDGTIAFPMVGQVQAAGKTLSQIQETLTQGLAPNFAQKPSLHVAVSSLAKPQLASTKRFPSKPIYTEKLISVFGMGELVKPGKMQLSQGTSLIQFIAQAGGTTSFAATKRIKIRRPTGPDGSVITYRVNVKRLVGLGKKSFLLQSGDVVIVPGRKLFE